MAGMPVDTEDQTDQGADETTEGQDSGPQPIGVIEIEVYDDGHLEVELESGDQEASEGGDQDSGQSCESIGEALKVALSMYKQIAGSSGQGADDQMAQGFSSVRGK